jgi:hypothetical protein
MSAGKKVNPKKVKEEYDTDLDPVMVAKAKEGVVDKVRTFSLTDDELRVLIRVLGFGAEDTGDVDYKKYQVLLKKFGG